MCSKQILLRNNCTVNFTGKYAHHNLNTEIKYYYAVWYTWYFDNLYPLFLIKTNSLLNVIGFGLYGKSMFKELVCSVGVEF